MDLAKDFGTFLHSQGNPDAEYAFLPFRMYHMAVLGEGSYSSTSNTGWGGEMYAMTVDFDQRILNDILRLLPDQVAIPIQDAIENQARPPAMLNLPYPIDVDLTARLGACQQSENEDFIPFVVTKVSTAHCIVGKEDPDAH